MRLPTKALCTGFPRYMDRTQASAVRPVEHGVADTLVAVVYLRPWRASQIGTRVYSSRSSLADAPSHVGAASNRACSPGPFLQSARLHPHPPLRLSVSLHRTRQPPSAASSGCACRAMDDPTGVAFAAERFADQKNHGLALGLLGHCPRTNGGRGLELTDICRTGLHPGQVRTLVRHDLPRVAFWAFNQRSLLA